MILYLDTSALIKLYVGEAYSTEVRGHAASASSVYTHLIAYAETRAGFAKARRTGRLGEVEIRHRLRHFERDWQNLEIINTEEALVRRAGDLADRFELRGYDSVHLAAAEAVGLALSSPTYRVAVFDDALARAVEALGMRTL